MKYVDYEVTFSEVPDEISLSFSISGCKNNCKGCHSPHLAEDVGEPLTADVLKKLIDLNRGITCITFLGGDSEPDEIVNLARFIKAHYDLKVAWYSGRDEINPKIRLDCLDFIKVGPYKAECGPLSKDTTNQIFYKVVHTSMGIHKLYDITWKFWR